VQGDGPPRLPKGILQRFIKDVNAHVEKLWTVCSATIRPPGRVDSSFLLPNAGRCLMKNVTRPRERDGWRIEEATGPEAEIRARN
jgi:hypothetical protein